MIRDELRAYNEEHQARVLSESASLLTLQDKLDRLCTLEKYESSSATLSGQVQFSAGVKVVEVKKINANGEVRGRGHGPYGVGQQPGRVR